jgi:acetoin utilization protein AcuB
MLVEEIMKTEVTTLPPTAPIEDALRLLNKYHIRHIPIVDNTHRVIGIVSDRDVRDASPSIFDTELQSKVLKHEIQTIMSHPVVTVHPLDFVEEIALTFYEGEFACLPVVRNEKLVGIVTEKDMLYTMIQLTGTNVQGTQIEIKVPNKAGTLPGVANVIGKRNINISSILVYPYKNNPKYKILVFRIQTMNPLPIIQDLKSADYEVLLPSQMGDAL